jgi:hypothetical protein
MVTFGFLSVVKELKIKTEAIRIAKTDTMLSLFMESDLIRNKESRIDYT